MCDYECVTGSSPRSGMKRARSTYSLRITAASTESENHWAWATAVSNVLSWISAMFSSGPGTTDAMPAKEIIGIVHVTSGAVLVRWREKPDDAKRLADRVARDLDELSVSEFEAEWNVKPPAA